MNELEEYAKKWNENFSKLSQAEKFIMVFNAVKGLAGIDKFEIGEKPDCPHVTIPVQF